MIAPSNVEFHENVSILQFIKEVADKRKWIYIFHGSVVKVLIVLTRVKSVGILF
jgi:hypothetical protein